MDNIALVLLAAGRAARLNPSKKLPSFEGRTVIRHAVENALAAGCDPVVVVVGPNISEIRVDLDGLDVVMVENAEWEKGVGTWIQAGVSGAQIVGCEGAIISSADQPLITPEILQRLVEEHEETGRPIIASEYGETIGEPAFFTSEYFPKLTSLHPTEGCKAVILANFEQSIRIACPEAETIVD